MSSTITTASAPPGSGAPVMIRMASPGTDRRIGARAGGEHAHDGELDRRAAAVSAAWTA